MDTGAVIRKVTATDVEAMSDAGPDFRAWLRRTFLQDRIDVLVEALVRAGKADSVEQALQYLREAASRRRNHSGRVGRVDFDRRSSGYLFAELERQMHGQTRAPNFDVLRSHGIVSHVAVPRLLSGAISWEWRQRMRTHPAQAEFAFDPSERPSDAEARVELRLRNALRRVMRWWHVLRPAVAKGNGHVHEMLERWPRRVRRYYRALAVVYGEDVARLWQREIFEDEYLIFLTLMSWGSAITQYLDQGPEAMLHELSIFPARYDLGGGRIDALEIVRLGSNPVTASSSFMRALASMRFQSIGHLLAHLVLAYGDTTVRIREWKFSVGDGVGQVIHPDTVKDGPIEAHRIQVERYLSLAALSYNLRTGASVETLWDTPKISLEGCITYFFPQALPVQHVVKLNPDERERVFIEEVARTWHVAEHWATMRELTNHIVGEARRALDGRYRTRPSSSSPAQGILFEPGHDDIRVLVARYRQRARKFRDSHRIIEVMQGRKLEEYLAMHIDRLFDAIDRGEIEAAPRFNETHGGMVSCLLHRDRTPSMFVSFLRGTFHCFGCGAGGIFATGSAPEGMELVVRSSYEVKKEIERVQRAVVPERHRVVMELAQESLHASFRKSEGAAYLSRARAIDPELAYEYGAGYGSTQLVHDLMDAGVEYDELLFYGFLGLSPRVTASGAIVRALEHRGLALADIRREQEIRKRKGEVSKEACYPYGALMRRVTFPLSFEGVTNNFYGRSIDADCPDRLKHRKLSVARTGIAHGSFNGAVLTSGADEILVTEAAIEALTLIMLGKPSMAMIGVTNMAVLEEVSRFRGTKIGIALNFDENGVGQKATANIMRRLEGRFPGETYDYTAQFVSKLDGQPFNDYNGWLVQSQAGHNGA